MWMIYKNGKKYSAWETEAEARQSLTRMQLKNGETVELKYEDYWRSSFPNGYLF